MEIKKKVVWRESVYKNGFRCQICGALLFDQKAIQPTGYLMNPGKISGERAEYAFCARCLSRGVTNPVARIEDYHGDKEPGLYGLNREENGSGQV